MKNQFNENLSEIAVSERMFHAYILICSDNTLYAGWTRDIEKRIETHNAGEGAKYTRTRRPVKLLASWTFESKREAMRMEYRIKQMSRTKKLALAAEQTALRP